MLPFRSSIRWVWMTRHDVDVDGELWFQFDSEV